MSTSFIQVFTTVDNEDQARALARSVVQTRLVACAQVIGPLHSVYWWQGRLEESQEWLLLLKSRADLYPALEAWLQEHHPYDTPEILAVPVTAGAEPYLRWLTEVLRPRGAQPGSV